MLALKYLLMSCGAGMIATAAALLVYDLYFGISRQLQHPSTEEGFEAAPLIVRWRTSLGLALLSSPLLLLASSIVVVPSGLSGIRVSQLSGTLPGTLYAGAHMVVPLIDDVVLFDTKDQIFTTGTVEDGKTVGRVSSKAEPPKTEPLSVQSKEGLTLGLSITVRYRLDANQLAYIQRNLPRPVETEIVPPTVASVWREVVPAYTVRDVFSAKREEVRQKAAVLIAQKLAADGILVKEVMLRDVQLPQEYAEGLESLLLKEQENDRMGIETELKNKEVRIAELEAEAEKARQIKQAEGAARVRVLQAKAESDAMQYTLPLKQKQIEETKLEAQARKEATIQNAEADAQAKIIDGKAEGERQKVLASAEADRIRVTAAADAERLQGEAAILKGNPLLINKIIAERLSDKLQIMMVPADGKFFFANDVLRGMNFAGQSGENGKSAQ
jgi:regulator of protease activity HflC (stomatin/prohibitin superfamily)